MRNKGQPRFDVEALRGLAGEKVFARGAAYHQRGQVEILSCEAHRVLARVSGSEDYRAVLTGQGKHIDGECSCPAFEEWGICKHMVAAVLTANEATEDGAAAGEGTLARIRRHLRAKEADALVEIILGLAERDATLFRELDMAAAAALEDEKTLCARFRKAINDATRTSGYIHYREVPGWASEVASILDRIAGLVADGRAALALRLIDHALARIGKAIGDIDDSDGHGGALLERARAIHLDACRAARPEPVELARELYSREVEGEWDTFHGAAALYADVLGEEGLSEYRRLATAAWEKLPPLSGRRRDMDNPAVDRFRLAAILDFFAERDGDVEARIAIRAKDLSSPWSYLDLAQFCLSQGREAEALRWAEEGLWVFENDPPDERLVAFAVDLLSGAGRAGEAEALLWRAFERRPSLDLYQRLRRLGGEAARDRAITALRAELAKAEPPSRWHFPADFLIRVLMEEAMFAEAWEAVRRHGASNGLKASLAMASEAIHPSEALGVYAARVDQLVSAGGNGNYEEARRLIDRMAQLRDASAQAAYVTALKTRFKAKRNFMRLMGNYTSAPKF